MMGWESFVAEGRKDEALVAKVLLEAKGGSIERSTEDEDINQHVDFWWTTASGERLGVDVKGMKKVSRDDPRPNNDITWLEFRNVHGEPGWLHGASKYIAFRRIGRVLFIDRVKLLAYAENCVEDKTVYTSNPGLCWKLYSRAKWGRDDLTCMAPYDALEALADFVIPTNPFVGE